MNHGEVKFGKIRRINGERQRGFEHLKMADSSSGEGTVGAARELFEGALGATGEAGEHPTCQPTS